MSPGESVSFEVPSRLDALGPVRAQAREIAIRHGFGDRAAEDFALCVHEAVSNAIVHGNQQDETRVVQVTVDPAGPGLRVTIRNQGPGFDVDSVLRSIEESGEQPRGRGIRIIRTLSDESTWRDNGREVTFTKRP